MGAAAIAAGGTTAAGGVYSAMAQRQAGTMQSDYYGYLAGISRINAGLAKAQGTAAREQIGAQEAQQQGALQRSVSQALGAQKAAAAAGGVGGSSRSAQDIAKDTLYKGNLDEMALRYNADLNAKMATVGSNINAMNYMAQVGGYDVAGANALASSRIQSNASLLGAAGSVANSWYMADLYSRRGGIGSLN